MTRDIRYKHSRGECKIVIGRKLISSCGDLLKPFVHTGGKILIISNQLVAALFLKKRLDQIFKSLAEVLSIDTAL